MSESQDRLLTAAHEYCRSQGTELQDILGHGTDGTVWKTGDQTAVKAFLRRSRYEVERDCYRLLAEQRITRISGLAVPELEGFHDDLMVIGMSIVRPPYLLDFGKVYLGYPPRFYEDEDAMARFDAEGREHFEQDWPRVQSLLRILEGYGIFYVDPKPGIFACTATDDHPASRSRAVGQIGEPPPFLSEI